MGFREQALRLILDLSSTVITLLVSDHSIVIVSMRFYWGGFSIIVENGVVCRLGTSFKNVSVNLAFYL